MCIYKHIYIYIYIHNNNNDNNQTKRLLVVLAPGREKGGPAGEPPDGRREGPWNSRNLGVDFPVTCLRSIV